MFDANKMHMTYLFLLTLLLLFNHTEAMSECRFNHPERTVELNPPVMGTISIPADMENNSTVYEAVYSPGIYFILNCSYYTPYGFVPNPELGPAPAGGYTFPIKDSGIAIQIFNLGTTPKDAIRAHGEQIVGGQFLWGTGGGAYTFRFIKIGKIKHGTVIGPINIGAVKYGTLTTHNITIRSKLIIATASCKTPNVSVNMGDYVASGVTGSRGQTNPVHFDIALNECQEGISRVTYSLQANTPVIDRESGLVSLDGTSTAKGVGLRIMDGNGTPLALDRAHVFSDYDTRGGNFKLPLSAAFVHLGTQTLGFGSANTSLTFTMSYL